MGNKMVTVKGVLGYQLNSSPNLGLGPHNEVRCGIYLLLHIPQPNGEK